MFAGLGHIDILLILYPLFLAWGLLSLISKLKRRKWMGFIVEAGTFTFLFSLHGGSVHGGFAAVVAALIVGALFEPITRRRS